MSCFVWHSNTQKCSIYYKVRKAEYSTFGNLEPSSLAFFLEKLLKRVTNYQNGYEVSVQRLVD